MSLVTPSIRSSQCTRYRYRYSECQRCADACPHEAIALNDEGATVNPKNCQNCALCISAVPDRRLVKQQFQADRSAPPSYQATHLECSLRPLWRAADAIVPCLGTVDGVTLAYLAKRGIPVTLHGLWHCSECPMARPAAPNWRSISKPLMSCIRGLWMAQPTQKRQSTGRYRSSHRHPRY